MRKVNHRKLIEATVKVWENPNMDMSIHAIAAIYNKSVGGSITPEDVYWSMHHYYFNRMLRAMGKDAQTITSQFMESYRIGSLIKTEVDGEAHPDVERKLKEIHAK